MDNKKFEELVRECIKEGVLGKYTKVKIDGQMYYVSFDFKEICDKCGK